MVIDCIGCLHGHYPNLAGGDVLIVTGDLTGRDHQSGMALFDRWLAAQRYHTRIVVGGNHDNLLADRHFRLSGGVYLEDSCASFDYFDEDFPEEDEGFKPSGRRQLKVWGSPWTPWFDGINPKCEAFTLKTEEELKAKFDLIPDDIDILVTHGPPWKFLDRTVADRRVGSKALLDAVGRIRPRLHVFSHIHESYGQIEGGGVDFVNCSHVSERYKPVNKAIRVIF